MTFHRAIDFENLEHDPSNPNPFYAIYMDQSTPIDPKVKARWLRDTSSFSRQYIMPFARPLARTVIVLVQVLKAVLPFDWRFSRFMHWMIAKSLKTFVRSDANYLILRHFHAGSEILAFIAGNVKGLSIPLNPLRPRKLDDLSDNLIVQHDLNLYNFIINLNRQLVDKKLKIEPVPPDLLDYSMVTDGEFEIEPQKDGWLNFIDVETAIELYTPFFQFMLTDDDFWRATISLQLDETVGLYAATIVGSHQHMSLVNNRHPMVPMSTLRAGFRLVLHGLSTEMGHWMLVQRKREQRALRGTRTHESLV